MEQVFLHIAILCQFLPITLYSERRKKRKFVVVWRQKDNGAMLQHLLSH